MPAIERTAESFPVDHPVELPAPEIDEALEGSFPSSI